MKRLLGIFLVAFVVTLGLAHAASATTSQPAVGATAHLSVRANGSGLYVNIAGVLHVCGPAQGYWTSSEAALDCPNATAFAYTRGYTVHYWDGTTGATYPSTMTATLGGRFRYVCITPPVLVNVHQLVCTARRLS